MRLKTFSSRAYSSTLRLRARILAMTVPKFPAPTTPIGRSDKLFEVIAYQAIVIVIECIQILGYDISFFVFKQWPFQMEDPHIIQSVLEDEVGLAFQVGGIIDLAFFLQVVDLFANALECFPEFLVWNFQL